MAFTGYSDFNATFWLAGQLTPNRFPPTEKTMQDWITLQYITHKAVIPKKAPMLIESPERACLLYRMSMLAKRPIKKGRPNGRCQLRETRGQSIHGYS